MGGWVVAYRILVSAPVPFWVYWGWNWVGLGWDWVCEDWGLRVWGLGLDNLLCFRKLLTTCCAIPMTKGIKDQELNLFIYLYIKQEKEIEVSLSSKPHGL